MKRGIQNFVLGEKHYRLTAIGKVLVRKRWYVEWLCECGQKTITLRRYVITGHTKSCGCYQRERAVECATTHGMSETPEYCIWSRMISRCLDVNLPDYKRYGGRGIKICKRWRKFENFYKDMGKRPSLKHTLERINTNGNYEPSNCRWATRREQAQNTRNSKRWFVNGLEYPSAVIAGRAVGISPARIMQKCRGYVDGRGKHHKPTEGYHCENPYK